MLTERNILCGRYLFCNFVRLLLRLFLFAYLRVVRYVTRRTKNFSLETREPNERNNRISAVICLERKIRQTDDNSAQSENVCVRVRACVTALTSGEVNKCSTRFFELAVRSLSCTWRFARRYKRNRLYCSRFDSTEIHQDHHHHWQNSPF
jgi:hypothetical protein